MPYHQQSPHLRRRGPFRGGSEAQDTPDETVFAAIIYVLVSRYAWRALPPCFSISNSTPTGGSSSGRVPACGAGCTRRFCGAWMTPP
jgi:hypothetical protein